MPSFPGPAGGTAFFQSNLSPISLDEPGDYVYVLGQLAAGASQLPVNDSNVAFEAAPALATQASIAVCLPKTKGMPAPAVAVEVLMNGAPGASESIAVQEADTHADGLFITPSNATYTISTFPNNAARADLIPTGGKYMRVLRTKGANAVSCRVKITRLA